MCCVFLTRISCCYKSRCHLKTQLGRRQHLKATHPVLYTYFHVHCCDYGAVILIMWCLSTSSCITRYHISSQGFTLNWCTFQIHVIYMLYEAILDAYQNRIIGYLKTASPPSAYDHICEGSLGFGH